MRGFTCSLLTFAVRPLKPSDVIHSANNLDARSRRKLMMTARTATQSAVAGAINPSTCINNPLPKRLSREMCTASACATGDVDPDSEEQA